MSKPRICFVSNNIYPLLKKDSRLKFIGGAELQQVLMGRELARRGYPVAYVTKNHGQKELETIGPFQVVSTFHTSEGIPILRFVYPRIFKIWRALNRINADIYYVRCAGYILGLVVLFGKLRRKKVIFCGANDPDFDPQRIKLPVMYRDKLIYFWGLKRCDEIVVQNKAQQKLLSENFNRKSEIIHNGFFETNDERDIREDILWVAKFKKFKNPNIFIELAGRIPYGKFVMIGGRAEGAGKNGQDLYDLISDKARELVNVEFKGFLPFEEVEQRFMRAKLLINTSEHEGFPNTFLQAWSRGIPVISFVDPDDLIRKNNLGWIVKDIDEMTEKVCDFLDNKLEFSSDGIKAFFKQNFTIETMTDKYEKLFTTLIT